MTFASIPSPSENVIQLGPLSLHAYGVCIALGALAAIWLSTKRWVARGGNSQDITAIATWAVPAGIVGARLYHVITDWELYSDNPVHALEIWDGGLGIWGGIACGVGVGLLIAKRRGLPLLTMLDVAAPALALAQAIGRVGNYFNQELFGKPTTLPWGLEIDVANRPAEFLQYATFHPTFLYEALWNLGLCAALLLIDRRRTLAPGRLFLLYVAGYTAVRFFLEQLRVDFANTILGMRINEWTSLLLFITACGLLIASAIRRRSSVRS